MWPTVTSHSFSLTLEAFLAYNANISSKVEYEVGGLMVSKNFYFLASLVGLV